MTGLPFGSGYGRKLRPVVNDGGLEGLSPVLNCRASGSDAINQPPSHRDGLQNRHPPTVSPRRCLSRSLMRSSAVMANPSIIERKERFARKMAGKAKPIIRSENRLPPGQHLTTGFPVLDLGIKPEVSLRDWRLEVKGLVENPRNFTWDELNALPQFHDVSDFHCVTTWSKFDVPWSGVAFFTLADIVRPKPEAKHVLFGSYDDYTTNVKIEDVMDDDVLIATGYAGQPLP